MTITNIISAIGNNNTIYPLMIRDLGIEAPSKILIARRENLKESKEMANDATREKFIDEYATSAIWLGGIPATELLYEKYMRKIGWNPDINLKLFKESEIVAKRNAKKSATEVKDLVVQGIDYNIEKFKNIKAKDVQDAVADLIKVKNNKGKYEKLLTGKFCVATIIPTIIMGFVLPKLNFALTRKLREKKAVNNNRQQSESLLAMNSFTALKTDTFSSFGNQNKNVSFTGNVVSSIANLRTVDKMALSDGGLTVGRISTSRNKDEAYVNAYRMIGSMILNYVTPVYIAKGLDKLANATFKINVDLDPKIMDSEEFANAIKTKTFEMPKSKSAQDIIEFLDSKPKSLFCKFAKDMKKVAYLDSGYRDPRRYVDTVDIGKFMTEFENFIKSANTSSDVLKFARKAKFAKCFNILANVGISSLLLAGVLPKTQYLFTKAVTGSYSDPGLRK